MPRLIECICQFYEFTRRAYRNGYRSSRESKTNDSKSRVALNRENIPFRRSPTWNTIARRRNVDSIVAIPSTSSSLLLPLFSVLVFLFFTRAAPLDCFPCPFQPSIVPSYHLRHCARAPFLPRFLSTFFLLLFPICPFFFFNHISVSLSRYTRALASWYERCKLVCWNVSQLRCPELSFISLLFFLFFSSASYSLSTELGSLSLLQLFSYNTVSFSLSFLLFFHFSCNIYIYRLLFFPLVVAGFLSTLFPNLH